MIERQGPNVAPHRRDVIDVELGPVPADELQATGLCPDHAVLDRGVHEAGEHHRPADRARTGAEHGPLGGLGAELALFLLVA
ncbi:MAG TPA: hypothetical protein VLX89_05925, partial [Actinomycetota bacterium]|nr:hypothetical protein [Actinomycetota bacterium]